jgi:hypothetical protein
MLPFLVRKLVACLLVFATSLVPALGHAQQIPVAIDAAFTPQEYDDLRFAIENWNTSLANRIVFVITPGGYPSRTMQGEEMPRQTGLLILRLRSNHPILNGPAFKNTLAMATGPADRGFVYVIFDRIPKRGLTGITMHEVGHSLGSGHLQKGLMEPRYSPRSQRCIDALTMQAVSNARRVQFDRLDWCR